MNGKVCVCVGIYEEGKHLDDLRIDLFFVHPSILQASIRQMLQF